MPKVSVIVPVWGVEKYIERCAVSLFEQTLDSIEYIFIDDCTPDRSMEILESIIEKYRLRLAAEKKNVRIERMPTNSGLPAVRRHGVQLATGDYIIACDSDDWIEPEMYENMYNLAKSGHYDLVQCDIDIVNDNGVISTLSYKENLFDSKKIRDLLICGELSNSLCNKLVSKSLYSDDFIYPKYNMDEDNVVAIQLAYAAKNLAYIKSAYYHAYQNMESTSRMPGEEQIKKRYKGSLSNSCIIVDFLTQRGYDSDSYPVLVAKNRPKMALWPITSLANAKLWSNTYSEINSKVLASRRFSIKLKILYLLVLTRTYVLYNFMRH